MYYSLLMVVMILDFRTGNDVLTSSVEQIFRVSNKKCFGK